MSNCNISITPGVQVFQMVTTIPTFILGVIGNLTFLIFFCWRREDGWNYMKVYLGNIAVADCLVLISLPFKMYSYYHPWNLNPEFCLFLVSTYYVNMYVSIFTITAISIVRFVAIRFPMKARTVLSPKKALVVCVLIWILICSLSANFHYVDKPQSNTTEFRCFQKNKEKPLPLSFVLVLDIVGFLLPFFVMMYCSCNVIHTLAKQLDIGLRREKIRSIGIVTVNLMVFGVCFLPFHFGFMFKFIVETYYPSDCPLQLFAHNFVHTATCIANFNCCLDIFSYYFVTQASWNRCRPFRGANSTSNSVI
ncbi:G-protein coupled receptor 55-like [Chanos chanos]|uniref:G-protein coupled receptor 55-like n=1 Tax=Chanos chanos TaxID=29144 RepID=A0A6J2WQ73_CHACN|nr:G-protein coupled receptor 55-like [Chanos chanos]